MSDHVIETYGLTKQYGGKAGCRDITLQVQRGVVFGFLGPNGAGKSTFVRTLLGLLRPTSGEATILGSPLGDHQVRKKIGYLPELFRYQDWLTGKQLLETHAELAGVPRTEWKERIQSLLERVNLAGREHEKIRNYSKGMQQRIGIACALIADPELIFLDEPTSALDPIGRREVRDLMAELRNEGKTIFLNSHLLSEVETVCDRIAIIHKGECIVQGDWRKLAEVKTLVQIRAEGLERNQIKQLSSFVRAAEPLELHRKDTTTKWLFELPSEEYIPELVNRLHELGVRLYELIPQQPNLEEVFLYWVNRKEKEHADDRKTII